MAHTQRGITVTFLLALSFAAILAGCSPTSQTTKDQAQDDEAMIRTAEATFRPSDHDPMPAQPQPEHSPSLLDTAHAPAQDESLIPATSEMAQGFRVQAYSTVHIDRARAKKADLEAMFPGEWFYLDYTSPSYRIRAGNFLTRLDADRFAQQMNEDGFVEAWVVPERVYKNIGRRPAEPPPPPPEEPEVK